jgi:hypothetical protein
MDNQPGKDRNRDEQEGQNVGPREVNTGQPQANPTGTSGRDSDLQKEGNLGNERNRNTREDQEEPGIGNRPGQNR